MFIAPSALKGVASVENKGYCRGLHGELVKEEAFAATTAATCHMLISADRFENYRVCDGGQVRIANGNIIPIAGYGDVNVAFRSDGGWTPVRLKGVAHVPQVVFNVVSLTSLLSDGHNCVGDQKGSTLMLKGGGSVLFAYVGTLPVQKGYRPGSGSRVDNSRALSALGNAGSSTGPPDINEYHCAHGHSDETLLKLTAGQQGIQLGGKMRECLGCSLAKTLERPIATSTLPRAAEKLERVFVGLSGKMNVSSLGGRQYVLFVRDGCTQWTRVYFLRDASDATTAFKTYLAEYRGEGTNSQIMTVQCHNERELFGASFEELCRQHAIRQEFTKANSPDNEGATEMALGMVLDAALAARIQAPTLYPGAPTYPSLWAEAVSWACDALNRTAMADNPGSKSPYELWHGRPPSPGETQPFLRPAICRLKRGSNSEPEAKICFYLGPEVEQPRGGMRVVTENRSVLTVRSVAWQQLPTVSKPPSCT
ncbi:unnamed protein product [Scytosiphon promiscuus]